MQLLYASALACEVISSAAHVQAFGKFGGFTCIFGNDYPGFSNAIRVPCIIIIRVTDRIISDKTKEESLYHVLLEAI